MGVGVVGNLWKLNLKINGVDHGFNENWHVIGENAAAARTKAEAIATARRRILPNDFEIAYATISNDDVKRDSKFLPNARGAGLFVLDAVPPTSKCNDDRTAIKIRFENEDGGSNTMLIVGIGDLEVSGNGLVNPPDPVTATYAGADPVAGDLTLMKLQTENFMKIITKYAVNVRSGHVSGQAYNFFAYNAAYYIGIGKKKGGKLFSI